MNTQESQVIGQITIIAKVVINLINEIGLTDGSSIPNLPNLVGQLINIQ